MTVPNLSNHFAFSTHRISMVNNWIWVSSIRYICAKGKSLLISSILLVTTATSPHLCWPLCLLVLDAHLTDGLLITKIHKKRYPASQYLHCDPGMVATLYYALPKGNPCLVCNCLFVIHS